MPQSRDQRNARKEMTLRKQRYTTGRQQLASSRVRAHKDSDDRGAEEAEPDAFGNT
jgi:hypothetical protein